MLHAHTSILIVLSYVNIFDNGSLTRAGTHFFLLFHFLVRRRRRGGDRLFSSYMHIVCVVMVSTVQRFRWWFTCRCLMESTVLQLLHVLFLARKIQKGPSLN